ncbi:alcohol dehydrogenase family protein [Pseudovibrio exalbescens]|uniref:alcohol dehydrogenase family protein n=1 Tax=Pseudovibrio exalbescens TaxID=197461 RepID=UPI0023659222|nr:alcohol dehydrogenase family protein [Pseudovibrio exalbescens]MDD7911322.1 alcohol dehydrogenase family protein [Pseudovibrio exalbescens]
MTVPSTMKGMVLTGHGGFEALEWREDLPVPTPKADEVLIKVGAASVNNTDINTRVGWYSKAVRGTTESTASGADGSDFEDGGWSGKPLEFPRIQGADCCGTIVAVGSNVDASRVGERVLVRPMQTFNAARLGVPLITFGSEYDGGFAEYAAAPSHDVLKVSSALSDLELASFPCAYSTAEGMMQKANVGAERVLITGASGGVGSAGIQLAKRRGAHVTALSKLAKAEDLKALGADAVLDRDGAYPKHAFDVVVDLVAGPRWPELIDTLVSGGRYVASGAIAGPIVELDVRTLYLQDLTLMGSTRQPDKVFEDLVRYIENGEIKPLIAARYPLKDLIEAQKAFLAKGYIGKIGIEV